MTVSSVRNTSFVESDEQNVVVGNDSETKGFDMDLDTKIDELRKRILPVLLFCQANKGDLQLHESWDNNEDRNKKYFYAYYSGLFCRILCLLESSSKVTEKFLDECEVLLVKYHWRDLQDEDFEKFKSEGNYACEVPEAIEYIDGIDDEDRKDSGFVCLIQPPYWTASDVRGNVKLNKE